MPSVKDRNEKFQDEEEDLVVVSQTYLSINAREHLNINVSQSCINALLSTSAQLGQLGSDELSRRCKQKRLEEGVTVQEKDGLCLVENVMGGPIECW